MKEKTLKSQILYEGKILNVYKDKVELENGKEDIREYVQSLLLNIIDDEKCNLNYIF